MSYSHLYLADIGHGPAIALLGLRSFARGQADCACIEKLFASIFSKEGAAVVDMFQRLATILGQQSRRKIQVGAAGILNVTMDELSIICALSAAQTEDFVTMRAHLTWLFGKTPPAVSGHLLSDISAYFDSAGYHIDRPNRPIKQICCQSGSVLRLVG